MKVFVVIKHVIMERKQMESKYIVQEKILLKQNCLENRYLTGLVMIKLLVFVIAKKMS